MSESNRCPACGASLLPSAPGGLCPKCLLQAGMTSAADRDADGDSDGQAGYVAEMKQLASRFPQLEIVELLGRGGMGAVYKARQPSLDRFVAIKILPAAFADDPAFAERFAREAKALARLSHQNIVSIFDFGEAQGQFYFVMEYVDGATLRRLIETGAVQPAEALSLVSQICDALQFAHGEGIVHRDIKPENILVDKKGRVKIADFGLAKLLQAREETQTLDPSRHLTGTNQVMGTVRYMAPEQMEGSRAVDHRADIYSLGVVFYELLTGELPLGRFAPPSQKAPIDARLDDVVLRSLEKEPARRYQQASEIKLDVENISSLRKDAPPSLAKPQDEPAAWRDWWSGLSPAGQRRVRGGALLAAFVFLVLWLSTEFKGGLQTEPSGAQRQWTSVRTGFRDPWFSYATGEGTELDLWNWSFACGAVGILLLATWHRLGKAERDAGQKKLADAAEASSRKPKRGRPLLVWPLAVSNLLLSLALLPLYAAEDPIPFPEDAPWIWRAWSASEQVVGYAMAAATFAASIGLLLWKWWARRLIVVLCVLALLLLVVGMPYHMRGLLPHLVSDANREFAQAGLTPEDVPMSAETMVLLIFGGCLLVGLPWIIGQLIYFTRPRVVAAFEANAPAPGALPNAMASLAGAVVGVACLLAPVLLLMGVAMLFDDAAPQSSEATRTEGGKSIEANEAAERLLHAFKPGVDQPGAGIEVDEDAWRLANTENVGNYKADLFDWSGEIPDSGVIACRCKLKADAQNDKTWGRLMLGHDFIEDDIGEGRYRTDESFHGNVREWRDVELRAPVEAFFRTAPPAVLIRLGVYAEGAAWVKDVELWHIPAPADDLPPAKRPGEKSLRKFTFRDRPIHRDYTLGGGWRFSADGDRTVRFFEIADPDVDNCRLVFRARLRTEEATGASLRLTWKNDAGEEFDSAMDPTSVAEGDTEWAWYEATVSIPPGERPRVVKLLMTMRGKPVGGESKKNLVWIKDIELLTLPPR
jgi:serine/threonine protein kinase